MKGQREQNTNIHKLMLLAQNAFLRLTTSATTYSLAQKIHHRWASVYNNFLWCAVVQPLLCVSPGVKDTDVTLTSVGCGSLGPPTISWCPFLMCPTWRLYQPAFNLLRTLMYSLITMCHHCPLSSLYVKLPENPTAFLTLHCPTSRKTWVLCPARFHHREPLSFPCGPWPGLQDLLVPPDFQLCCSCLGNLRNILGHVIPRLFCP